MKMEDYRPNQEFIGVINSIAPFIQAAAAEVASNKLQYGVDPNTLPEVRFVDNESTRDGLQDLQPWTTPVVTASRTTPLGNAVVKIEIHPDAIAQRTMDIMTHLGGEDLAVARCASLHSIDRPRAKRRLIEQAALFLLAEFTLAELPDIDPHSEISVEVVNLALYRWNPESR